MRSTPFRQLLLAFLLVLLCFGASACGASAPSQHVTSRPTSSTKPCAGNVALLFFHHPGQDGIRCVESQAIPPDQQGTTEQAVMPPVAQVYKICAEREEVFVEYASYEDPAAQSLPEGAMGSIYLDVQAQTCQTILSAVNEESMIVTGVWFVPFFGGQGYDTGASLIHQVGSAACAARSDFFRVWYDNGKQQACYADAGILELAHPLTGVTKACSGNNRGIVYLDRGGVTGISLELTKLHTCATAAALVHENTITVNMIVILPASSAA